MRVLLALACLIAAPALAQDGEEIAMRLDRLVPGTTHVYDSSERGRYFLTYRHGENGGFIIEQRDGDTLDAADLFMTIYTDVRGRWVRQVATGGTEIRFEPHNCLRSLEYCEYEAFIDNQPAFPLARQATLQEGGLRYELWRRDTSPRQLIQSGTVVLDEYGLIQSSVLTRDGGAVTHTIERQDAIIPGPDRGPLPTPSLILR